MTLGFAAADFAKYPPVFDPRPYTKLCKNGRAPPKHIGGKHVMALMFLQTVADVLQSQAAAFANALPVHVDNVLQKPFGEFAPSGAEDSFSSAWPPKKISADRENQHKANAGISRWHQQPARRI